MSSQVKGSAKIADHNKILCCVSMITYWMITLIYVYIIQSLASYSNHQNAKF